MKEGYFMDKKKFYITTPIYYASGNLHIGHAYTTVVCDAIARYKKMRGYDVFYATGTDEHGEKVQLKAAEKGVTPKEYVDELVAKIKDLWKTLNIDYDKFIRTTDEYHEESVQKIFSYFLEKGDIYKGKYEGWYCTPCESFWTESQLVDGKCPDCGRSVHEATEEAYFFRMSKYSKWLEEYIEKHPRFIEPESRKNEIMNNFIKPGLQDLCVSRTSFKWGVPVSFNEDHVVYVWIDALSNYITFLGYSPDGSRDEFKKYWPANIHLIGKDILRFHTIYWPIMLHALGVEMPEHIFGHPWMLFGNDKMSKSKGNIVYADDLVNKYGVDAIRFYMIHEMPYASDGVYTEDLLIDAINGNLANVIGNLVNRTIGMANKYFDGIVENKNVTDNIDDDLIKYVLGAKELIDDNMDKFRVADALENLIDVYRRCNKYIDETMPWVLAKEEDKKDRLNTVLYNLIESIRIATVYLQAFLPDTAKSIFNQINTDNIEYDSVSIFGGYKGGTKVNSPEVLFKRIDKE